MRIICSTILSLCCLLSLAQPSGDWTLQRCIDHALEQNIQIRQSAIQGEIIANNINASKMSRYPNVNGSGSHNYNIGRTIDPFTNTFSSQTIQSNSFSINAGVLIYGGGQINNTIKQNEVAGQVNEQSIEVVKNQISLAVANTFLQIVQGEENLKLAKAQKELTSQQLERGRKLVESGSANKSTTLNLEAQLANDEVQIINAQNSIQLGYMNLINLMQLDPNTDIKIAIPTADRIPEMQNDGVSEIYEKAYQNLPEVKQAELTIAQNKLGEKIAAAALKPSLSAYGNVNSVYAESGREAVLTGFDVSPIGVTQNSNEVVLGQFPNYDYVTKPFGQQLGDNLGQSVGLSLSVPIFNGMRNKTNVMNAKLNTEMSEMALKNTENQLKSDISQAYTNLLAAKARLDAAVSSETAQRKNFDFSQARFDAGMMNTVDLLNAKNAWSQSQINVLNSKYEYIFRNLIIEFYKGNPLTL